MDAPRATKVGWYEKPAAVGSLCKDHFPRFTRQLRINTHRRRQAGLKNLQRTVHRIPAKDRTMLGIVNCKSHLAARMARQRDEPETRTKIITVVDQIGEACLDDWNDAFFQGTRMDGRGAIGLAPSHQVIELTTAE